MYRKVIFRLVEAEVLKKLQKTRLVNRFTFHSGDIDFVCVHYTLLINDLYVCGVPLH
jgi:hypothetical protein